jgi:undecaprenyl phosphate N,N'-diacetylbacillosamine 1-phosphate transferase
MYNFFLKRFFDLTFSFIGLIAISPILLILIILIKVLQGGNVFYIQVRPGLNEKKFKAIKFKTMNDNKGPDGTLLPDKDRLTRIGKFIRSTSLDELPQLINIFKGEMSFIGPRPLLVKYLPLYSDIQKRRHDVRPGLTGWAQINGRNNISWNKKFELDVWYVDHLSLLLDLKIFFKTIEKVLLRTDISKEGNATTEPFRGNN